MNAYNANTVALVLTRYPELASIKDLGGLFSSPWKQRFVELLGATRSLDEIEHQMIRGGVGATRAARCTSRSTARPSGARRSGPRPTAATRSRRSSPTRRDAFSPTAAAIATTRRRGRLEVSQIFEWYGRDFERAAGSVAKFLAAVRRRS